MKITLISPYTDLTAFGVRTLCAFLKKHHHSVQILFLQDPYGDDLIFGVQRYQDVVLKKAANLCSKSDLIGISVMTNFFDGAVQITRVIKEHLDVPVIWGGVHPTIRPEESLEHADMVAIGEGEESLLRLVDAMDAGKHYLETPGILFKKDGVIIENVLGWLPKDLDVFPRPDYSMEDHHILMADQIVPLTHEILRRHLQMGTVSEYLGRTGYQTMTSRGCPYGCSYCINSFINQLYGSRGKLRWRSVDHVIDELLQVKANMPYVDYIWISDDEFMARKTSDLRYFAERYKQEINLPFSCLISPLSVTEEKMSILVDAGLIYVQMGVESGSTRMQEIYNRTRMNNRRMMNAVQIIHQFSHRMHPPSYDFLIDVPYETLQDKIDSLQFISRIPKPYRLQPFVLILYPGTDLHTKAKKDGLICNEAKEIYSKSYTMREQTYLNLLITLARKGRFPGLLLRILSHQAIARPLSSKRLKPMMAMIYSGFKTVYNFFKRVS